MSEPSGHDLSSTMRIDLSREVRQHMTRTPRNVRIRRPGAFNAMDAEQQAQSESRYRELLRGIYDAVLITDLNGQVVDANPRASAFLGYAEEDLLQRSVLEFIAGSDATLLDSLRRNLESERFVLLQAYCQRQDQTYFPSEISINLLRAAETRMCFFIRDISVRREQEDLLRIGHNAIQNAVNGIAVCDLEGAIQHVNPAWIRLWGYPDAEALQGARIAGLFVGAQEVDDMLAAVYGPAGVWRGEIEALRPDGSTFPAQVSAASNRDSEGELIGMVLAGEDLTDRKKAEEVLREREAHGAMLASFGATCHHLGQPATVLLANLQMMLRYPDLSPEDRTEMLASSIEAAEQLRDLLNKMNMVDAYRLVPYIENLPGINNEAPSNKIIDL
ncbi:MAG: PAS domain S-box protein [Candidatus Marinimicrobia bacterium]|nr:PAS domain S-box protein [Candidatus Neomarinimicrobiota bacterium]